MATLDNVTVNNFREYQIHLFIDGLNANHKGDSFDGPRLSIRPYSTLVNRPSINRATIMSIRWPRVECVFNRQS